MSAVTKFGKKGLPNGVFRAIIRRVSGEWTPKIGMSPSGKASDFDSDIRRFESGHPSQFDPLAQSVEQLPFKQWVRGSSPRRVTKKPESLKAFRFFAVSGTDTITFNGRNHKLIVISALTIH